MVPARKKCHLEKFDGGTATVFRQQIRGIHVFNIKGNAYRLMTEINYKTGKIFIRQVLTHADYSKGGSETMSQKDLTDIFGTPSIASEVLSGKRELSKDHIRRLATRFRVSPELFF